MEKYHILTKEEIINKLKAMEVGEGKEMTVKIFHFLTPNPYYDPNTFSQEIEDSEEPVNIIEEIKKETSKPEFDFVWNNTISNIKTNSDKWQKNHTKICEVKLQADKIYMPCATHEDGTRNYYSEENLQRILELASKWRGIINFT